MMGRSILRIFCCIVALLLIAAGASTWWYIYRPLPQLDGTATLPGLQREVVVERDRWGVPHIRAATLPIDQQFRTYGFARAAERDVTLLDREARKVMEAYARGVNKFIEQHENNLPLEFSLLRYKPQPWQPSDSLVISAYMYRTLTDTWERELNRAKVTDRVGADRAKDLFSLEAAMDHFVVGDPNVPNDGSQRSAADADGEEDDEDMQPDTVLKAALGAPNGIAPPVGGPDLTSALWPSIAGFLEESRSEIRRGIGSNNWVVSGAHTATGKPLLANDTHLELSIPSIWYEIHVTAPRWNV